MRRPQLQNIEKLRSSQQTQQQAPIQQPTQDIWTPSEAPAGHKRDQDPTLPGTSIRLDSVISETDVLLIRLFSRPWVAGVAGSIQLLQPMDYKSAGVDVEAGRAFVQRIKSSVEATHRPEVIGGLGGFGGMMRLPAGLRQPLLVSGTDGVGTKLELAQDHHAHHNVGIDLVAMCVNDVITSGAQPLFFLDYMATGALSPEAMAEVVEGIADGCRQSGCSLLGGETAEMPGFYPAGRYDLAGFCVAVVEEK